MTKMVGKMRGWGVNFWASAFLGSLTRMASALKIKGAYYLAKKSGNFGLKSNGKVIFRKFRSEIVE